MSHTVSHTVILPSIQHSFLCCKAILVCKVLNIIHL